MKIKVYGIGALGSNLLVQLVKQFPDFEYEGIDFDKIEERNMRTQAYFRDQINQPKAMAMRAILSRYVEKPKYTPKLTRIETKIPIPDEDTLALDCFDNVKSRELLTFQGKDYNIIHLGFSPAYSAEFMWNKNYSVPGDVDARLGDICSMTDAVGFINMFVNLALINISDFIFKKVKKDFIVTRKTDVRFL